MSEKKIMFKVGYGVSIEPVEVVKLTKSFVTYIDKRWSVPSELKRSRKDFFETWEEARTSMLADAQARVIAARRNLELANARVGNIKGLTNPDEFKDNARSPSCGT
jgi:hypothetical protein